MPELWLIRHGARLGNVDGSGAHTELTDVGRQQAGLLRTRLHSVGCSHSRTTASAASADFACVWRSPTMNRSPSSSLGDVRVIDVGVPHDAPDDVPCLERHFALCWRSFRLGSDGGMRRIVSHDDRPNHARQQQLKTALRVLCELTTVAVARDERLVILLE